jgi:hypothetical protein
MAYDMDCGTTTAPTVRPAINCARKYQPIIFAGNARAGGEIYVSKKPGQIVTIDPGCDWEKADNIFLQLAGDVFERAGDPVPDADGAVKELIFVSAGDIGKAVGTSRAGKPLLVYAGDLVCCGRHCWVSVLKGCFRVVYVMGVFHFISRTIDSGVPARALVPKTI